MGVSVEEVKPCRKCAVQIPIAAKVCPYCRRSQRSPFKILGLVLLLTTAGSLAGIWAVTRENPVTFLQKRAAQVRGKVEKKVYPGLDDAIARKKVKVGMRLEQVRTLIGEPYQINKAVSDDMETEQWVVKAGGGYQYLYFDNGILKTIETK